MDDVDVAVIGGGPAGLAAALWAGRYRRTVLLADAGHPRNRWVDHSHGYLGSDGVRPAELLERARTELERYPEVRVVRELADDVRRRDDGRFEVALAGGGSHLAHRVVLATGVEDRFPQVAGFFDHYGADVFHCPTCDGYEARGRQVVVLGWSEHVAGFALGLLDWAATLAIVTDGRRFEGDEHHREQLAAHGIRVVEADAEAFVGRRGELRAIRLASGDELPCDMSFFSIAHAPSNGLAERLGCEMAHEGCVLVDERAETTVEGVYAAGDLTPGIQLVQVAAAKGAIAGTQAAQSLRGQRGAATSPTPAPDPEAA